MMKILLAILVLVLILAAAYFTFPNQINSLFFGKVGVSQNEIVNQVPVTSNVAVKTPTSTPIPETLAEDDLTALEKELAGLEKSEADFNKDLNSL
ncbi:MAG: hypothetical protein V1808_00990 [Candidatus Daviesbacteria bacterium]